MFFQLKFSIAYIFTTILQVASENTYAAYIPKHIRPGFAITYSLSIFNVDNPIEVRSNFSSGDGKLQLDAGVGTIIHPESSANIVLGSLPFWYNDDTNFRFFVEGHDNITGQKVFSDSTTDFVFTSKTFSIFIQTDKAIYQPSQIIKFRIICVKPDLRPFNGNISYEVQDPNDNIVLLKKNILLSHGITEGEFPLNRDSVVGDWKISGMIQNYKKVVPVTVEIYKLPKFKVELQVPSLIHANQDAFNIKLSAMYTFGKPVQGIAKIQVKLNFQTYSSSDYAAHEIVEEIKNFNGAFEKTIQLDDLKNVLEWSGTYDTKVVVNAFVTESTTGVELNESQLIKAKRLNIKIENIFKPATIKPGLTYKALVRVTRQNGSLLSSEDLKINQLIVKTTYNYPLVESEGAIVSAAKHSDQTPESRLFEISPDGMVVIETEARADTFESVSFDLSTNETSYTHTFTTYRAQSPSNSYLQMTTFENRVYPDNSVNLSIKTTEAITTFQLLVMSRGKVHDGFTYDAPESTPSSDHSYSFTATHAMIPDVRVLATYVRSDGEIVADYFDVIVMPSLQNQVSIETSSDNVDAGKPVSIKVNTSSAGAYVGIRAIDESVLLLKSGNDLTMDKIIEDLNNYSVADGDASDDDYDWWTAFMSRPSSAKDSTEVFKRAGMILLTDARLYRGPPITILQDIDESYYDEQYYDDGYDIQLFSEEYADEDVSKDRAQATVRSFFPETWLWLDFITRDDNSTTFRTVVPDTITSWVLSAFSVSDQYGLGIADTSKVTVFRKFFVSLNLPLKVTRGEIIIVQTVVFNYFDTEEYVRLEVLPSDEFELISPGDDKNTSVHARKFLVPSQTSHSISFPLRMNNLGDVAITVTAQSPHAGDALRKTVFVRPEGIEQCYSTSVFINRISTEEETISDSLTIKIPPRIVDGSAKVYLHAYGDILGSALNNLGRLLRTPGGCGEQNMVTFAPDVFVTRYLHKAGKLDADTQQRAFQHFYDGYSVQLKYKHSDGSYSAFGERDNSGSTWLTAFVAKCFIYARELRPELVENRIIDQALDFLAKQQYDDGSFREPGRVSHKALQGGVNSLITMTAYVLITLSETDYPKSKRKLIRARQKARLYVERNAALVRTDPYALAMATYSLHVSSSPHANQSLLDLEKLAVEADGVKYLHAATTGASKFGNEWVPPYSHAPTNDVEMTSYALLTYIRRGDLGSAVPVVKWLTSKQNDLGGFTSTQDTVIAVQALSEVAFMMSQREQNLLVYIQHSTVDGANKELTFDQSNSIVFRSFPLPSLNDVLQISASGVGVAVVQLSVCYNIPVVPFDDEAFKCSPEVVSDNVMTATVNLCCRLKPGDSDATGMFLIEIGLPNGFTVELVEEKERNQAELVELGDATVNFYFNELSPDGEVCANVMLQRNAYVAECKPSVLRAYEYYKPEKAVTRLYSASGLADAGVCDVCGVDCVGCNAAKSFHLSLHACAVFYVLLELSLMSTINCLFQR